MSRSARCDCPRQVPYGVRLLIMPIAMGDGMVSNLNARATFQNARVPRSIMAAGGSDVGVCLRRVGLIGDDFDWV